VRYLGDGRITIREAKKIENFWNLEKFKHLLHVGLRRPDRRPFADFFRNGTATSREVLV